MPEVADVLQYVLWGVGSVLFGYYSHPYLLVYIANVLELTVKVDVQDSANFFFTLVAVVYAILVGSTFQSAYDRQQTLLQELYDEIMLLERILQAAMLDLPKVAMRRPIAMAIRRYINEEFYSIGQRTQEQSNQPIMDSPFAASSPWFQLAQAVHVAKEQGGKVASLRALTRDLAKENSERASVLAVIFPAVHWLFMIGQQILFLVVYMVFDASAGIAPETITVARKFSFSALMGTLVMVQLVLVDLNLPVNGLYSFRPKLKERLAYALQCCSQMEEREDGWIPADLRMLNAIGLARDDDADPDEYEDEYDRTEVVLLASPQRSAVQSLRKRQRGLPKRTHRTASSGFSLKEAGRSSLTGSGVTVPTGA